MIIQVEYNNALLGRGVFWTGTPDKIWKIRNVVARSLAERVAADSQRHSDGMWTAYTLLTAETGDTLPGE